MWLRLVCVSMAALATFTPSFARSQPMPSPGEVLFTHKWVARDEIANGGDGLGPMHNETSCAGCHSLGGLGGAGGADKNVDILSIVPLEKERERDAIKERLAKIHPGFRAGGVQSLVLHRFGPEADFEAWRSEFFGIKRHDDNAINPQRAAALKRVARRNAAKARSPIVNVTINGVDFRLTRRNTTALFGAGLIDAIPETALRELATHQEKTPDDVAGRVPPANQGGIGRFGWRGQTATLADFVRQACANELGLESKGAPQGGSPRAPNYKAPGPDLTELQLVALTAFVAAIPRPQQIRPTDRQAALAVDNGEKLFATIGCATCHVPDVSVVTGLYSDLLLHDMGDALADLAPANAELIKVGERKSDLGYASGTVDIFAAVPARIFHEWRTPPLWGVRDSEPYLHDGRAATLDEAIRLHGGEAANSARRYADLPDGSRANLVAFLNTLAAPGKAGN